MDASSLVFVGIVAVWAAYLLPQWVRRRDSLAAGRSRDRFSVRSRVLSPRHRRTAAADAPSAPPLHAGRRPAAPFPVPAPSRPSRPLVSGRRAARRRRRLLIALVLLAAASWGAVLTSSIIWLAGVPASVLLGLDISALVVRARRRRARAAARRRELLAAQTAAWRASVARPATTPAPAEPAPVEPAAAGEGGGGDTWTPVPVPPPTYTLKPAVRRPDPAPLDLSAPVATSAAAPALPNAGSPPDTDELDLDAVLARRRAVAI